MDVLLAGLSSIIQNPLRSLLTIIGIVVGIATVIIVVAIGEGTKQQIQDKIQLMGANLLVITPGNIGDEENGLAAEITEEHIVDLRKRVKDIEVLSPLIRNESVVKYKNINQKYSVLGAYAEYSNVRKLTTLSGRYYTSFENINRAKVCVLSESTAIELFSNIETAINKEIFISDKRYRVIGVVNDLANMYGTVDNSTIYIPFTVANAEFEYVFVDSVFLTINDTRYLNNSIEKIEAWIKTTYNTKNVDYWVQSMTELLSTEKEASSKASLIIAAVACLSLIVGGIGIMNIMLVTVTERTKEIGLRKAVGANDFSIFLLFIVEGVALCVIGGILGILLGIATLNMATTFFELPVKFSWNAVSIAIIFSSFVGLIFSLYPAFNAAKMPPIEALHYE